MASSKRFQFSLLNNEQMRGLGLSTDQWCMGWTVEGNCWSWRMNYGNLTVFAFSDWRRNMKNSMLLYARLYVYHFLPAQRIPKDPPMEGWMNLYYAGVLWVFKTTPFSIGFRIFRVAKIEFCFLFHGPLTGWIKVYQNGWELPLLKMESSPTSMTCFF